MENAIQKSDERVYRFNVMVYGDVPSFESLPIYDDADKLIGAFVVDQAQTVRCFVSGVSYPGSIAVSVGDPFYFTTYDGPDGKIVSAILTDYKLNEVSILVDKAI